MRKLAEGAPDRAGKEKSKGRAVKRKKRVLRHWVAFPRRICQVRGKGGDYVFLTSTARPSKTEEKERRGKPHEERRVSLQRSLI